MKQPDKVRVKIEGNRWDRYSVVTYTNGQETEREGPYFRHYYAVNARADKLEALKAEARS